MPLRTIHCRRMNDEEALLRIIRLTGQVEDDGG